jgi:hypothetical protein
VPQFDLKKATVTFLDGDSNSLTLKVAEGTLSYDEKKPRKYTKDRGILSGVMNADQEPVDVKIDLIWEFLTASSGGTPTPEDVLKNRGEASGWVSSDSDACNPFAVDIVVAYVPNCSPTQNERITLPTFRYESIQHDFKNGVLALTGKCNVTEANVARY